LQQFLGVGFKIQQLSQGFIITEFEVLGSVPQLP
jgi:hypothetical protein